MFHSPTRPARVFSLVVRTGTDVARFAPAAGRVRRRLAGAVEAVTNRLAIAAVYAVAWIGLAAVAHHATPCLVVATLFAVIIGTGAVTLFVEGRPMRGVPLERGFSVWELLVAAGVLAVALTAATAAFGSQTKTRGIAAGQDSLRDVVSAADTDAAAVAAYDVSARSKIASAGRVSWVTSIAGTGAAQTVVISATGNGGTVSFGAKANGQQASLLAPVPDAKPTPQ